MAYLGLKIFSFIINNSCAYVSDANKINSNAKIGEIIDVQASQVCSICHGNVGDMTKVKQVRPLKMGACVNCHRDNGAPADCAAR